MREGTRKGVRVIIAIMTLTPFLAPPLPAASQAQFEIPCAATDKDCLLKVSKAHPAKTAAFWKPALAKPIGQRIGPAPKGLVEYLHIDNQLNGYPDKPRSSRLSGAFLADVRGAIADMPSVVRRVFNANFAGVWFVDDLGGTGFTDIYVGRDDKPAGGYIVLDAAVLGKFTANTWATWKENTPFKAREGWTLDVRIENAANDDRRSAIRYILLHELGHVLSINRDIHPRWDIELKDVPESAGFPFFALSWTIDRKENRYVSTFDETFPMRKSVTYYVGARLDASDMVPAYDGIEKTNFPTLYAATAPGDDFAESFVSYVHAVLMKRPWEIAIRKDGTVVKTYRSCWDEKRCAAKRRILENLLR